MRIGQLYRQKMVDLFQGEEEKAESFVFINFAGLDANSFNDLRSALKGKNAKLLVGKNKLLRKAFESSGKEVDNFLETETAVVYSFGDIVEVVKTLVDFSKENEKIQIKGGLIQSDSLGKKELEDISKLPSRDVLLGMTVNCIASPISSLVNGLNQIILKFAWALEEIKKQKDQGGKNG